MITPRNLQRFVAGAVAVATVLLAGCSDDSTPSTATVGQPAAIAEACLSVDGELLQLDGDTWTCDGVPAPDDARYLELIDFFTTYCVAPLQLSHGVASEEPRLVTWSCWSDGTHGTGAAASPAEAACAQVQGSFEAFNDLEWTCRDVTMSGDVTHDSVEYLLLALCPPPLGLSNGQLSETPLQYGWSCSVLTIDNDITLAQACEFIAGTLETREAGAWTCTDVPLVNDATYGLVNDFLLPLCPAPLEYTSGNLGGDPPLAGWSCSVAG